MVSNYFILRGESEPNIVGIKNGGSQACIDRAGFADKSNFDKYFDFFATRDARIWSRLGKFPDFEFTLEHVRLERDARLTDFLSYYPEAFRVTHLMSERAVRVLENYKLPPYRKYPAKVFLAGANFAVYYLVYLPVLHHEVIDFKASVFYEGDDLVGRDYLKVGSIEEYRTLKGKKLFDVEKLVLNEKFDAELDIFNTHLTYEFIVSARLKEAIEGEGLTGMKMPGANSLGCVDIKVMR